MEDSIWNLNMRDKEWEPSNGSWSGCQSFSRSELIILLFSFSKFSGNYQIVPETLSTWFTGQASSERNRGNSFHITILLSFLSYDSVNAGHNHLDQIQLPWTEVTKVSNSNTFSARQLLRKADPAPQQTLHESGGLRGWRHQALTTRESHSSVQVIDSVLGYGFCCHIVANSDFLGKDKILLLVKSFSFSMLAQIYKTMCSEQN